MIYLGVVVVGAQSRVLTRLCLFSMSPGIVVRNVFRSVGMNGVTVVVDAAHQRGDGRTEETAG
jgi:hypothetical protein